MTLYVILQHVLNFLFILSIMPSDLGCRGVVRVLFICSIRHNSKNKVLSYCLTWSECTSTGHPYLFIHARNITSATVSAVIFSTGQLLSIWKSSLLLPIYNDCPAHLLEMVLRYLWQFSQMGHLQHISAEKDFLFGGFFRSSQISHFCIYYFTSRTIPHQ